MSAFVHACGFEVDEQIQLTRLCIFMLSYVHMYLHEIQCLHIPRKSKLTNLCPLCRIGNPCDPCIILKIGHFVWPTGFAGYVCVLWFNIGTFFKWLLIYNIYIYLSKSQTLLKFNKHTNPSFSVTHTHNHINHGSIVNWFQLSEIIENPGKQEDQGGPHTSIQEIWPTGPTFHEPRSKTWVSNSSI